MVLTNVSSVHLDIDHQNAFRQALKTILALPITERTMAQLVDGLPEVDVAFETRGHHLGSEFHPLNSHERLCDGVLKQTRLLRDHLKLESLEFESHVNSIYTACLSGYANAAVRSREFNMRLIEMVAVSLLQIAAYLFNLSPKSHTPEYIQHVTQWQPPTGWVERYGGKFWQEPMFAPPQTHFLHASYTDFDLYPKGVADMAGYWAEDRILGGVVVFDRGASGHECRDIFLDSGRDGETIRIWSLLDEQLTMLVDYLLDSASLDTFSVPLCATDRNRYRYDHWDAIALHRIFRDPWERRIPLERPPERDVRSTGDYPELGAWLESTMEAAQTDQARICPAPEYTPSPSAVDQSWIYGHGGHAGVPLGARRIWKGPPREPTPSDNGEDDTDSWASQRRSCELTTPARTIFSRDEIEELYRPEPGREPVDVGGVSPPATGSGAVGLAVIGITEEQRAALEFGGSRAEGSARRRS